LTTVLSISEDCNPLTLRADGVWVSHWL